MNALLAALGGLKQPSPRPRHRTDVNTERERIDPAPTANMVTRLAGASDVADALRLNRLVISGVDGTHMGIAVNWWAEQSRGALRTPARADIPEAIRATFPPFEILRSAIEVILTMAEWVSRNDHCGDSDGGRRVLHSLAADPLLRPSQRILCDDLARVLGADPDADEFVIHRVGPESAMPLIMFLSRAIENRFEVPVETQVASFRSAVLRLEHQVGS